jgi:uncharacterized membrane protein
MAMATESRWQTVVAKADALEDRVEKMERGGDLEGLIEDGLEGIVQEIYQQLLAARERAASAEAAAFSPSELSSVRGGSAAESGSSQGASDADAAREGAL